MIITSVERGKKDNTRFNIHIDGKFAFSIAEEDYFKLELYEKKEITQIELEYILEDVIYKKAKNSAIRFVTTKYRSIKEVSEKLLSLEYDMNIVEKVVKELVEIDYLNDFEYAKKYINNRLKLNPKSRKIIRLELKIKGIEDEILDRAFSDIEVDEIKIIKTFIEKKFSRYNLTDKNIQKKVYSFLCNKGFSFNDIKDVLREFINPA